MEVRDFLKIVYRMKLFVSLQSFTCHIVNAVVLKNFVKFMGKHLRWGLFINKGAATILKRDTSFFTS